MHILCIVLRYIKLKSQKYPIYYNKTRASVLFLGFRCFEIRNIYKQISRIPIFSIVSLFIDSRAGLVLSIWFVLALELSRENNFMIAKLTLNFGCAVVLWTNHLRVYRRLLTNRLYHKQALGNKCNLLKLCYSFQCLYK